MYNPGKPQFSNINVGYKGVFITRTCFLMETKLGKIEIDIVQKEHTAVQMSSCFPKSLLKLAYYSETF